MQNRIQKIIDNIHAAEEKYSRPRGAEKLLTVSKKRSVAEIQQAIAAGLLWFGESYIQEAIPKITAINNPKIIWHFIGPIQSNKTKQIAEYFSWAHSIDREKIARRLNEQRPAHLPPLNVCVEVNISNESTKSGVTTDELSSLARTIHDLPNLNLRGLMSIPQATDDFQQQRDNFHKLREALNRLNYQDDLNLDTLSMGMSNDYQAAIAEGATIVRIGTAIFGLRCDCCG